MRRCIKRWQETGRIDDKESISRSAKKTKITTQQLSNLDRIIDKNPDLNAERAMNRVPGLKVSVRTVRRYLIRLGWKVIRTKFCQFVSIKNRIERYFYSNFCLLVKETYILTIFIDECTVELCRHASFRRFRNSPNRIKLVGKYSHEASVHIIGGISRRGR